MTYKYGNIVITGIAVTTVSNKAAINILIGEVGFSSPGYKGFSNPQLSTYLWN